MLEFCNCSTPHDADIIFFGVPYGKKWENKEADYVNGPKYFRDACKEVYYPITGKIRKKIFDLGDFSINDIRSIVEEYQDKKLIVVGGSHEITYYIIKCIHNIYDSKIFLISFDAHPDLYPEDKLTQGSWIYYLLEEGILNPRDVLIIGVSNPSLPELEYAEKKGVKILRSVDDLTRCIEYIPKDARIYLSIDVDVCCAPAAHWYEPLGISPRELLMLITEVARRREVWWVDIVEFKEKMGAKLAALLAINILPLL